MATRRDPDVPLSDLVERFLAINRRLDRLEMVHCLCILGEACYLWGWAPQGSSEAKIATFFGPQDLQQPLMLIEGTPDREESPLGVLVSRLFAHVTNSVLGEVQDFPWAYGIGHDLQPYRQGMFQTPPARGPGQ